MHRVRTVPDTTFRARCLSLLDAVATTGEAIVVTRGGRPVARIESAGPVRGQSLRGSVTVNGDLLAPLDEPA